MGNEAIRLSDKAQDALSKIVLDRFEAAQAARNKPHYKGQSINQWLQESFKRFQAQHGNERFNLTRIKAGSLYAKTRDMVVNSVDAPFTISPTPLPTLSKEQEEEVLSSVERALADKLLAAGIVITDDEGNVFPDFSAIKEPDGIRFVPSVAKWLKMTLREQKLSMQAKANAIARKAAEQATKVMQDQMSEGGWREAFLDACFDIFLYGTGCIRQELREQKSLKWSGESLKTSVSEDVTWRHVPIANCYPSADSESAQEGSYFIERAAMRKQDLFAAAQIDWIDAKRVRDAYLKAHENFDWLNPDAELGKTLWDDDALIDVLIHEGVVKGDAMLDYLQDADEADKQGIDEDEFYSVEAIVLSGVTIGMRVLNYMQGERSYFSANFQRAGRLFWGIGAAMSLSSIEDRLNGYIEDLDTNVDMTVAPPIFYDVEQFENPQDVTLRKRQKIPFAPEKTGGATRPPFYQPQFDSKSAELVNLFNWVYRLSDDESGIPSYMSGNDQLAGGESTFRGMKLLAASANMLIKSAFLNIDQSMIQPAMSYLWRWNMLNHKDSGIKADVRIVARGTSGLVQQEVAAAERSDAMPIVMQLLQSSGLPPEQMQSIVQYLLRDAMQRSGMTADALIDDPNIAAEQNHAAQQLQPSTQPATPMPTIGADHNTGGLHVT